MLDDPRVKSVKEAWIQTALVLKGETEVSYVKKWGQESFDRLEQYGLSNATTFIAMLDALR